MSTKADNRSNPASCWNKAADDEPIFVLRAKDPLAADTVRAWVGMVEQTRTQPVEKINGALLIADSMQEWRHEREASRLHMDLTDLQHRKLRDRLCDAVAHMVNLAEHLGYTIKLDPQVGRVLNGPVTQRVTHVANVDRDPAGPSPLHKTEFEAESQLIAHALDDVVDIATGRRP